MDDDAKALAKVGMEVALGPVVSIAEDVLGRLGGDWLHENRARNRAKLRAKTEQIFRKSKIEVGEPISPSILVPLLSEAQEESRDELIGIWARLLAAAADPKRAGLYRREFVDIVKRLEPLDIIVLPILANPSELRPSRLEFVATILGLPRDQIELSFRNLERLELISDFEASGWKPYLLPAGRQLLAIAS
jgi:hypothetical protein